MVQKNSELKTSQPKTTHLQEASGGTDKLANPIGNTESIVRKKSPKTEKEKVVGLCAKIRRTRNEDHPTGKT